MVTFPVWFYKPIISHFSNKMHLLAYRYSSGPVSASFLPRDWMEPMERWRATGNQRSSAANLIQWKQEVTSTFMGYSGIPFPMELRLPALSVQFTWMIRIWTLGLDSPLFHWLKPTQWCDVKICYSIRTKKNGKGTQGLQRGAFVVQGISFKPGSNCQSRMIGGNKKKLHHSST